MAEASVKSVHGRPLLTVENYLHYKDSEKNGTTYFRCVDFPTCKGRAKRVRDDAPSLTTPHHHPPAEGNIEKRRVVDTMKEEACRTTIGIQTLYRRNSVVAVRDGVCAAENLPTLSQVKSPLHRSRLSTMPLLPTDIWNIVLEDDLREKLIFDINFEFNPLRRAMCFSTDRLLQILPRSRTFLIDGTFKAVPYLFGQLVTLHAFYMDEWHAVLHMLLPDKRSYGLAFQELADYLAAHGIVFPQNSHIISDFEVGLSAGFVAAFPTSIPLGCLFHYGQCVWRKAQEFGLQAAYNANGGADGENEIYGTIRRILSLPLIPLDQLDDAWMYVHGNAPNDPRLARLLDYVVDTWLEGIFPREMWNRYNTPQHRTVNGSEGWHSKWNRFFGKRLNIHQFGREMCDEIASGEIRLQQLENGEPPKPRRRRYRALESRLARLMAALENQQRTLEEYVDSVAHLMQRYV